MNGFCAASLAAAFHAERRQLQLAVLLSCRIEAKLRQQHQASACGCTHRPCAFHSGFETWEEHQPEQVHVELEFRGCFEASVGVRGAGPPVPTKPGMPLPSVVLDLSEVLAFRLGWAQGGVPGSTAFRRGMLQCLCQ